MLPVIFENGFWTDIVFIHSRSKSIEKIWKQIEKVFLIWTIPNSLKLETLQSKMSHFILFYGHHAAESIWNFLMLFSKWEEGASAKKSFQKTALGCHLTPLFKKNLWRRKVREVWFL